MALLRYRQDDKFCLDLPSNQVDEDFQQLQKQWQTFFQEDIATVTLTLYCEKYQKDYDRDIESSIHEACYRSYEAQVQVSKTHKEKIPDGGDPTAVPLFEKKCFTLPFPQLANSVGVGFTEQNSVWAELRAGEFGRYVVFRPVFSSSLD